MTGDSVVAQALRLGISPSLCSDYRFQSRGGGGASTIPQNQVCLNLLLGAAPPPGEKFLVECGLSGRGKWRRTQTLWFPVSELTLLWPEDCAP